MSTQATYGHNSPAFILPQQLEQSEGTPIGTTGSVVLEPGGPGALVRTLDVLLRAIDKAGSSRRAEIKTSPTDNTSPSVDALPQQTLRAPEEKEEVVSNRTDYSIPQPNPATPPVPVETSLARLNTQSPTALAPAQQPSSNRRMNAVVIASNQETQRGQLQIYEACQGLMTQMQELIAAQAEEKIL